MPAFTASIGVEARITPTAVEILDGGTIVHSCPLPAGSLRISPSTQSFGTVNSDSSATRSFTLSNQGTDCVNVTAISSSAHFSPSAFTPFALAPLTSQVQNVTFNPSRAIGSFAETLAVSRTPATGDSLIHVTGQSVLPQTTLTIRAVVLPPADPGRFNLLLDGAAVSTDSGTVVVGPRSVTPGLHTVGETAGTATSLSNYVISIDCGSGAVGAATLTVNLAAGDSKTCVVINLGRPRLTINLLVQPASATGAFNLLVDGSTRAAAVRNGATTGPLVLSVGNHLVSQTAAPGTNLTDYTPSFTGGCAANGSVSLSAGDDKICTVNNARTPEPVSCFVFDDGYTNLKGPSDAIYISGRPNDRGAACIPDGTANGKCAKWFGRCFTNRTRVPVTFSVFDDGYSRMTGPSDALFVPKPGQVCEPDGTASGTCRKWFGRGTAADGRAVTCEVFTDGASIHTGLSDAIFIPNPLPSGGAACIPNGTASGTCLRWFGRCQVQ